MSAGRLTVKDLGAVNNAIWNIRSKFYNLGFNLGIDSGTLDVANKKSDDEALTFIVKTWLQRSTPTPTWKALIQALRRESLKEEALADEIAKKYCPEMVSAKDRVRSDTGNLNDSEPIPPIGRHQPNVRQPASGMGLSGTTLVVMAVVVAGIAITVSLGLTSYYADHTVTASETSRHGGSGKVSFRNFPHMNEKPTMNQLNMLERGDDGNPVRIAERIGAKNFEVGTYLLQDDEGVIMTTITENARGNTEAINREIFRRWLAGSGASVSWKVLVDALEKAKLKALTNDIVDALHT